MKKSPGGLTYAAETRERVILDSHLTAKHKHQYPGTLIDWDYIVSNIEKRYRVSKAQQTRNGRAQK